MRDDESAFDFICAQAKRRKAPTHLEHVALVQRAHAGDQSAWSELVVKHQGLVTQRVNKYGIPAGMDPEDLQQEGTFGLIRAIRNYKWELGFRFSTFAAPVIDQFIERAVKSKADLVAKPSDLQKKLVKAQRKWGEHIQEHGRKPTQMELSALSNLTVKELTLCQKLFMDPVSLDKKLGEDDDFCLGDTIACGRELPGQTVCDSMDKSTVRNWIEQLNSPEDKFLICSRYGMLDGEPKTRSQLAQKLSISELEVQRREKRIMGEIEALANLEALNKEYARDSRRSAAEWKSMSQGGKRTSKRSRKNTVTPIQGTQDRQISPRLRCLGPLGGSLRRCIAII